MPAASAFRGHPFRVALWTLKGVALAHVGFTHVMSAAPGWGPSMLPTFLVDGQWFVVDRRARRGRGVRVAREVIRAAVDEGVAAEPGIPADEADLEDWIREQMWDPVYRPLRRVEPGSASRMAKAELKVVGSLENVEDREARKEKAP